MSLWLLIRRKDRSASRIPAATQRFLHRAVLPARHAPGRAPGDGDHRLDAVGIGEILGELFRHAEPAGGEHLLEPLAKRRRRVGMVGLELASEASR